MKPITPTLPTSVPPARIRSFWQRRIVEPIVAQLTQGTTPEKIALTIAVGVAAGLFPFLGFTTLLCFVLAFILRLNQPIIHLVNQVLWPVHLTMILVYVHFGAWIYQAETLPFDPAEVPHLFLHSQREFWARFGLIGLHAFTAWAVTVPFIVAGVFFPLRHIVRRLSRIYPIDRFLP